LKATTIVVENYALLSMDLRTEAEEEAAAAAAAVEVHDRRMERRGSPAEAGCSYYYEAIMRLGWRVGGTLCNGPILHSEMKCRIPVWQGRRELQHHHHESTK
jgi:hypothetical protein